MQQAVHIIPSSYTRDFIRAPALDPLPEIVLLPSLNVFLVDFYMIIPVWSGNVKNLVCKYSNHY